MMMMTQMIPVARAGQAAGTEQTALAGKTPRRIMHPAPPKKKPKDYRIRAAFQRFGQDYKQSHALTDEQRKAVSLISKCKTGELGYVASFCAACGYTEIHNRSCNNRNCPCCQAPMEKKWVIQRESEMIPDITYYHVVFTVPHELNDLIFANQKVLYKLLMKTVGDTLITLCQDKKYMGATPGIIEVLHTWGSTLLFHPHVHCIVSGGGLTKDNRFVKSKHKGFFIPVRVLGKLFRGKLLAALKKLYAKGELQFTGRCASLQNRYNWSEFIDKLYRTDFFPFAKETFNDNGDAMKYLARYAYRTAISESRIKSVDDESVTYTYKDYKNGGVQAERTVTGEDFIGLFLMHVLPQGFHRVRFCGFLANCHKTKKLKLIHSLLNSVYKGDPVKGLKAAELMYLLYGVRIDQCPCCHGTLVHELRPPDGIAG